MTGSNEERLLTVNDVAERLQLHPITVRRHIKAGKLRAVRVGRAVRVREADLDDFLRPDSEEYATDDARRSSKGMEEYRSFLRSIPDVKRPHRWPPTKDEMERRKELAEEGFKRRDERGPIGISTVELVRQGRRERDEKHDRTSGISRRRIRRGKMASDRREPYQGS